MNKRQISYEDILNAMDCRVCVYDKKGTILYCNDMFQRIYLSGHADLSNLTFTDIKNKEYRDISFMAEAISSRETITRQQKRDPHGLFTVSVMPWEDREGNRFLVETIFSPVETVITPLNRVLDNPRTKIMIHSDNALRNIMETISRIGTFDSTILITGESGTGKSMLARYIHENSRRSHQPFVTIDCATIPENLIESELFGYVSGAFTGARQKGKPGMVELADKGTLFLDEIGLLHHNLQSKFLQLIQEKTYTPIGSVESKKVDIRIISATNLDLEKQIMAKKFREDLYYRLRVIEFHIPPLRERPDALDPLIDAFLELFNGEYSIRKSMTKEAKELLKQHNWPGNIRELEYLIERLWVTSSDNLITAGDIPPLSVSSPTASYSSINENIQFDQEIENRERELLQKAFEKNRSSYKTAEALGITQTRASRLLRKHKIR